MKVSDPHIFAKNQDKLVHFHDVPCEDHRAKHTFLIIEYDTVPPDKLEHRKDEL
jgi:hypothetical protein